MNIVFFYNRQSTDKQAIEKTNLPFVVEQKGKNKEKLKTVLSSEFISCKSISNNNHQYV